MKDIYLEFGDLDTEIYHLKENDLKFGNPFSDAYKETVQYYNALCEKRRLLEKSTSFK